MESSDIVYVVTTDDELPVSLQLFGTDGTLQPQILPRSSLQHDSSDDRDVVVYDERGNDIADDVIIEMFEYVVDENGEVFPVNSNPFVVPSLNGSSSVTSSGCTTSLMPEDSTEPNTVNDLKARFALTVMSSKSSNHLSLDDMNNCGLECDKLDVSMRESRQVLCMATDSSCVDNGSFSASSAATVEEDHNVCTSSALCREENVLNNSHLSSDLQLGKCSVSIFLENLHHSIPDTVSILDLAANNDVQHTGHISASSLNTDEFTGTVVGTTSSDVTATSCAVEMISTVSDTYDVTSNLTANCSTTFHSCEDEDGAICHQSADELNGVSVSCLSTASSCNEQLATNVVNGNYVDDKTDSSLQSHPAHLETPVTDSAAVCMSDSYECQFGNYPHKPAAICDNSSQLSISSHSPVSPFAKYCSSQAEQPLDDLITAVSKTAITPNAASIPVVATDELHPLHLSYCSPAKCMHVHTGILPLSTQQCFSEVETPLGDYVSGSVKQKEAARIPAAADYSNDTAEEFTQQKDDIASLGGRPDANVVDLDTTLNAAFEDYSRFEPSDDTRGSVMLNKEQEFTNNSECQLPIKVNTNPVCDGRRHGPMKRTNICSGDVTELRQRLRDLHGLKKQLRKEQQNKTTRCTLRVNMDLETLLHPVKCKRLKLETLGRELTEREMSIRYKEERLDRMNLSLDRREQAVCERDQLLSQHLLSLTQLKSDKSMTEVSSFVTDNQLNQVSKQGNVHESDVVMKDHGRTRKHVAHRLPK